ncbi:hypothetical protein HanIR_Chr14g0687201 [Helianthus annuus]|nr:hypothetical protein HanIR_Chr14g0687201 [Helianthus annuus]
MTAATSHCCLLCYHRSPLYFHRRPCHHHHKSPPVLPPLSLPTTPISCNYQMRRCIVFHYLFIIGGNLDPLFKEWIGLGIKKSIGFLSITLN